MKLNLHETEDFKCTCMSWAGDSSNEFTSNKMTYRLGRYLRVKQRKLT